jgi:hypothetical protein
MTPSCSSSCTQEQDDCWCSRNVRELSNCLLLLLLFMWSASGKTTVCDKIIQRLHDQCVVMLNQDSFYRSLTQVSSAAGLAMHHTNRSLGVLHVVNVWWGSCLCAL